MDFIIILLFFAVPVIAAIADSKKSKKAKRPQVHYEPIDLGDTTKGQKVASRPQAVPSIIKSTLPLEGQKAIELPKTVAVAKTIPAIAVEDTAKNENHWTREEKRKLVVYSEIMRPKWSE